MKKQHGVALSGLIFWGIVVALVAVLGMKVVPSVLDYYKTLKACKSIVAAAAPTASVKDIKNAYMKYQDIDGLDMDQNQLEITKQGGQIVINFAYDKKIALFGPVSLLIEYHGSTAD